MTALCIKDGLITYPAQRERALAYQKFEAENPELGQKELSDQWKVIAAEKGWDPGIAGKEITPYGEPKKEYQFNQQFIMGGFTGLIGLIFVSKFLLNRGCWIEADENGLRTSEKREMTFDQVTALDKKKWANKGIAKVLYEADGSKNKIVLDDCNYERDSTQAILRHVEAAIGHDKIVNGKPEPPPKPAPAAEPATSQAV